MTLTDRLLALGSLTLQDPRAATRALLAEGVPMPARSIGLLLVAVLSALFIVLQAAIQPMELDPVTAQMLHSPIQAAIAQWFVLGLSVVLIYRVGRAFGGHGSFADALLIVVWLQVVMLALQVLQILVLLVMPPLAGIIALASFVIFFWLMASFVAELHGFASRGAVLAGIFATSIAAGLTLGVILILIIGPEAFLANV